MIKANVADPFPMIKTDRLVLCQLQIEDTVVLHEYWSDEAVTEYFTIDPFTNIKETIEMVEVLKNLFRCRQGIRWAIVRKNDSKVLGTCGFHNLKPEHLRVEMGYELGKKYWGQGFMAEALTAILDYGFNVMQVNRIEAFVNQGNGRSVRILEKMGFKLDGLLRNYEFARGKFVDQYCYSLLKSDY